MIENGVQNGDIGAGDAPAAPKEKGPKKKLSVERIYQKKTQLEHILLRPDTYIGSVEKLTEPMWLYDEENQKMVRKEITYVPGLYKIFDEILVNAADNKQRDPRMNMIKIDIKPEENRIAIWNNGKGIPVVMHKDEKMFVPTMIFGHLLTSSNYNDEEQKVTGGRNGYGAKLCNIFSTKFVVETSNEEYGRSFKQSWADNMSKTTEPQIKDAASNDYTKITFHPDLAKFKMESLDKDIIDLMHRRAFDVAASTGVSVYLNGKKLAIKSFKDYVNLFIEKDDEDKKNVLVYERPNERWEVAVTLSEMGFQQMSFVNSIATTKGGRHVDHVVDAIVKQVQESAKKKNKGGMNLKPFQVKNHLWVFINCLIVNPTFDSQTKENMTLVPKSFGSKCNLSEKFYANVLKCGIVQSVIQWAKFKEDQQLAKSTSGKKQNKLKGIPKLEDANWAGTRQSLDCTLILTEGDSAKTLAVSGLSIVGRDKYGVFPLRGKLLNVREASHKQILENAEINHVIKILGLQYKKKYESVDDLKTLRYGKLMIMTDQDQDGSHIKGLLINFIHHNWPSLLRLPFLEEFITPIVKATKKNEELSFFSLPEFEEWKTNTNNWYTYKIKYYKGLGTSTSKEAKEYFQEMSRHQIKFYYGGTNDDSNINMAFSKKCVEQRKEWLTQWMEGMKRRREMGLPDQYLYEKNTTKINYTDFVNKELVLFSNSDNERSIPSMMDGLKPGQRKVLFTCLKRNDKREVKVAQLAGSVAEHSAYHHGEASLMATIINMAQNYVGSNNINLLMPIGQFGSRLQGGKDAASPRYIFTKLSPMARYIFHPHDDPLLAYQTDDNQKIEPVWYIPIIPMVLVNGADGIGTGWMTKIPNFNPRHIVENLRRMLDGEDPKPMIPWYKNFRGTIELCAPSKYMVFGECALLGEDTLEITELPIGTWTSAYKESVLEPMSQTDAKTPALISEFSDHTTDTTVRFVVTMARDKLKKAEIDGLHKIFKLQTSISTSSMCAFDSESCLRKYDTVMDILRDFYTVRLEYYGKRKGYLEGMLQADSLKLSNQARFIMEKCSGELVVENKKRKVMIEELLRRGYDPDPVRTWKLQQNKDETLAAEAEGERAEESQSEEAAEGDSDAKNKFDYLLGMPMWSLTEERKRDLLKKRDEKLQEYEVIKKKTPSMFWREDLDEFMKKLDEIEEQERKDEKSTKTKETGKGKGGGKKKFKFEDTQPSKDGERVEPKLDADTAKKIENAEKAKTRKITKKKENVVVDDEKDEFDELINKPVKSLKDRLGNSPEAIDQKLQAKRKALKQTKLASKPKEKKRVKLTVDTSDEDDDSVESVDITPSPVRTVERRQAATKVKFNFDDEDEDEQFSDSDAEVFKENPAVVEDHHVDTIAVSGSDSEFEPTSSSSKQQTSEQPANISSDAMFDSLIAGNKNSGSSCNYSSSTNNTPPEMSTAPDMSSAPEKKKGGGGARPKKKLGAVGEEDKPAKPKKAPAKRPKKKIDSDEDDDNDSEDMFGDILPKESDIPARKGGRVRKVAKYTISDDDDSDFE